MSRNAILCYLMGAGATGRLPVNVLQSAREDADGPLLFALYCALTEDVDQFADTLPAFDSEQLRIISSYCLMLGLSGPVQISLMLFDALKSRKRACPTILLDLARLQEAWGYLVPALRSQAMYRKLTGQGDGSTVPRLAMAAVDPGPIHILDGDLPSVRRA